MPEIVSERTTVQVPPSDRQSMAIETELPLTAPDFVLVLVSDGRRIETRAAVASRLVIAWVIETFFLTSAPTDTSVSTAGKPDMGRLIRQADARLEAHALKVEAAVGVLHRHVVAIDRLGAVDEAAGHAFRDQHE